jgi:hypothetical protein
MKINKQLFIEIKTKKSTLYILRQWESVNVFCLEFRQGRLR